ncbi:MAG: UvrD-helicase domain-containing protein, partial [Xanthomonadales bacterium]|nr:UvrD-helicase domain-containing protein [Xanthomonadales bacterium]
THRLAYLVREERVAPWRILAVTFTNKAAREMRERLGQRLPASALEGLTVSTFHALGLRLLQAEARAAGLRPGFSILDGGDSDALFAELAPRGMARDVLARLKRQLHQAKADGIPPQRFVGEGPQGQEVARLYADYQARLAAFNAVDFDDLIARPLWLLESDEGVRERWHQRFIHLLVDEYQDTNPAQYRLIRALVGPGQGLAVVGDDDQSIYAWRGADPRNLFRLQQDFPDLQVIKLERNYRCAPRILKVANELIANNAHLVEKRLWSGLPECEPIRLACLPDVEEEARWIAYDIADRHRRHGRPLDSFAVLYRSHHLSRPLEVALRERDLPYRLRGGSGFFERPEVKDLLAHLRVIANAGDDGAFLRAVRTPRRGIGDATLARLGGRARELNLSLADAAAQFADSDRGGQALHDYGRQLQRWRAQAATMGPATLLQQVLGDLNWSSHLRQGRVDAETLERREASTEELLRLLGQRGTGLGALAARLTELAISREEKEDDSPGLQLLTLHAAKGLEFDEVYLLGLDEGTLPHEAAAGEGRLEEERRLLYVGITRARQALTLSYPGRRSQRGESFRTKPSRFLEELPADDLAREAEKGPADPAEREARTRARLADMRALLGLD